MNTSILLSMSQTDQINYLRSRQYTETEISNILMQIRQAKPYLDKYEQSRQIAMSNFVKEFRNIRSIFAYNS